MTASKGKSKSASNRVEAAVESGFDSIYSEETFKTGQVSLGEVVLHVWLLA